MGAVEEAQRPVGIALAVREPATEEAIAPRHAIGVIAPRRHRLADRRGELLAHALVGVEAKHPVVAREAHGELLLAPEAQPFPGLDARAVTRRDLHRIVGAARVQHERLVGERSAREAGPELGAGIARDDGHGEGQSFGGRIRHGCFGLAKGATFYPLGARD